MKKSEKGFTLVELLAIIAIISILIIIIAPKIMQIFKNAQRETFMSQVIGMVKSSNLIITVMSRQFWLALLVTISSLRRLRRKSVVAMHRFLIQPHPCNKMLQIKLTSVPEKQ